MKILGFVLLWLLGSIAAVSVAFAGIALVDDDLVAPPAAQVENVNDVRPPTTLSTVPEQTSVAERATMSSSSSSTSAAASTTSSDPVAPTTQSSTPSTTDDAQSLQETPTTARASAPSTAASVTVTSTTSAPQTTSSTSQASSTSTTTTAATTTAAPPTSAATQVRTFNLVGGTTAISFSSAVVEIMWATPNPGFDVEIKPGSNSVRVEFESDGHKSRIDAWWSDGPQQEIREDG